MLKIPLKLLYQVAQTYQYKITTKRLLNLAKVGSSMAVSRLTRTPYVWGYPCLLMVEPTNICNLKCPMCPSGNGEMTRTRGKMNLANYRSVLDELGDYLALILFWNQGEPFINSAFPEMITYAKSKGIPTMTSTNGHYIRTDAEADAVIQSGLDEIIVSLDGANQAAYEQYRIGGSFPKVMKSLELLIERKKALNSPRPLITLQFIVFKHNQQQIDEVKAIGKRLNVDRISLKTAQIYTEVQAETFLPDDEQYRRYRKTDQGHEMKLKPQNWCKVIWHSAVLNWDGLVAPCCFDKNGEYAYGNAFKDGKNFRELWTGSEITAFRQQILTNRSAMPMCGNCFEGMTQSYAQYIEV